MKRAIWILVLLLLAGGAVAAYRLLAHPSLQPYLALQLPPAPPAAGALRVRFMGTTTLLFDDGETALMVDGFFSRPQPLTVLAGSVAPDAALIDAGLRRAGVARLAAVMTAHSHYDHALDAAEVARRTGGLLIGSNSTANIGRGASLAEDRMQVIAGGEVLSFGRFSVRCFRSLHSPEGYFMGDIEAPLSPPAAASAYKEGGSFTYLFEHEGRRILVHPSANFVPGMYRGVSADVVLMGAGTVGQRDDAFVLELWREVVKTTGARLVVPIHWDDFLLPVADGLKPMPPFMGNFELAMQRLQRLAHADGVALRMLPLFEPVDVFATRP